MRVIGLFLVAASIATAMPARAEQRVAVIVGANLGNDSEQPLRFADKDAERVRDVLVELGSVDPKRAILIRGGTPREIENALAEARGRVVELAKTDRVTFLFYYSGHADRQALHLDTGSLSLATVRTLVARIPADISISIFDSCQTDGRSKGIQRGTSVVMSAVPNGPQGTVELFAAADGEAAQESDELTGGVFTHYLVAGLRGDADLDGDHRVTLDEIYAYTYGHTLHRTSVGVTTQHPAIDVKVAGAGEIVVTEPRRAEAFLQVPGGADRYLVFSLPHLGVIGELAGSGATRLAVPAGRYLIVRHQGDTRSVAQVDVSLGGTSNVTAESFSTVTRAELARRGGAIMVRQWTLAGELGAEAAPGSERPLAGGASAALSRSFGWAQLEVDAGFVRGTVDTTGYRGTGSAVIAGAGMVVTWPRRRWIWSIELGVEARYEWQHLVRDEADRLMNSNFDLDVDHVGIAFGPRGSARWDLGLGDHRFLRLSTSTSALIRRELTSADHAERTLRPVVSAGIGFGYAF